MIDIDSVIDFMIQEGKGLYSNIDRLKLYPVIEKHIEYKTCLIIKDKKGISSFCRWNVIEQGKTVYIIDLITRKDKRNKDLLKRTLIQGWKMYPEVEYLEFDRFKKYPYKTKKKYLISDILKRRS